MVRVVAAALILALAAGCPAEAAARHPKPHFKVMKPSGRVAHSRYRRYVHVPRGQSSYGGDAWAGSSYARPKRSAKHRKAL